MTKPYGNILDPDFTAELIAFVSLAFAGSFLKQEPSGLIKNWSEDFCKIFCISWIFWAEIFLSRIVDFALHILSATLSIIVLRCLIALSSSIHLFGVKISWNFTQEGFWRPGCSFAEDYSILGSQLYQSLPSFAQKFGIRGELDVLWHYGGVDDHFL